MIPAFMAACLQTGRKAGTNMRKTKTTNLLALVKNEC